MDHIHLVVVILGGRPTKGRVASVAESLKKQLHAMDQNTQIAFSAPDASILGFLVHTKLPGHEVHHRVLSPIVGLSGLENTDNLMVLEIGPDSTGIGNLKIESWIDARFQTSRAAGRASAPAGSQGQSQLASQLAGIKDKLGKGDGK